MPDEGKEDASKHLLSLLNTVEGCEEDMVLDCLELFCGLSACNLSYVSNFLHNSRLMKLRLCFGDFSHALASIAKSLSRSSVQVLIIHSTKVSANDIMCLARVLKETHITDLKLEELNVNLTEEQTEEFVRHLCAAGINKLTIFFCGLIKKGAASFTRALPSSTITCLNLYQCFHNKVAVRFLFSILPETLITNLTLGQNGITDMELEALKPTLRESKLKYLCLPGNNISDAGVDMLAEALVASKVTDLNLSLNQISGKNKLGCHLKDTIIETLALSSNHIVDVAIFPCSFQETSISTLKLTFCWLDDTIGKSLMRSLKSSKVANLNLMGNKLGLETVSEFASIVKDTNVSHINFLCNPIPAEGLSIIAECLGVSKVEECILGQDAAYKKLVFSKIFVDQLSIAPFIEKLKCSKINAMMFKGIEIDSDCDKSIARALMNTKFTHLDISYCSINDSVITTLAASLKYTNITHLKLVGNKFGDEGAKALAACLPETKISSLNLEFNNITACGAQSLASCLNHSRLYVLWVSNDNDFDDQALNNLAETIEKTFVTDFRAGHWYGAKSRGRCRYKFNPVLWKNQVKVRRLLEFIQKITTRNQGISFDFDRNEDVCINTFLDECQHFGQTIKQVAAINALAHAESLSILQKGITKLLQEEFPQQFALFFGSKLKHPEENQQNLASKCFGSSS